MTQKTEIEDIRAGYMAEFKPSDAYETHLVNRMAISQWRMRRVRADETAMLDRAMAAAGGSDPRFQLALAFERLAHAPHVLEDLIAFETRVTRDFHQALNELMEHRNPKRPAQRKRRAA